MASKWPYCTGHWKKIRRLIILRDNAECQVRLVGCTGRAEAVDHIVAVSDGGAPFDPANLRASCTRCNTKLANDKRARRQTLPSAKEW